MKQDDALAVLKTGVNVFLTGEPGSGKTHTVNQYIAWLKERGVPAAVTASTGIAASHVNGQTIHSWSGIGILDSLGQEDVERIMNGRYARRITDTAVLVIDEVSMLNSGIFDMLDYLFRTARLSAEPFGGMQIVCVGDFFQLPPVVIGEECVPLAFESEAWQRAKMRICYLTEQHRQEDAEFLELLRSIRCGEAGERERTLLEAQQDISYAGREPTMLHSHNEDVDRDNARRLAELPEEEHTFYMQRDGPDALTERMIKHCLSPEILCLKKGAMVMCTKNNPERGFFNGTLGTVVDFERERGMPIIETFNGWRITIDESEWSVSDGEKKIAGIKQVPLRLAWAITIHKSQGISLDAAEVNLSGTFVEGQGYVALSRVRTLDGLKVRGFVNPMALKISPEVAEQDRKFREASNRLLLWCRQQHPHSLRQVQDEFLQKIGVAKRVKKKKEKKHTLRITKELLQKGMSVRDIIKERDLKKQTIFGHIEKLAAEKQIARKDIAHLLSDNWSERYGEIARAFTKHTDENLFLIHETLKGKHTYDTLKLARAWYRLDGG